MLIISCAHDLHCRVIGYAHTCEIDGRAGLEWGREGGKTRHFVGKWMEIDGGEMQGGEGQIEKGKDVRVRAARHSWLSGWMDIRHKIQDSIYSEDGRVYFAPQRSN